MIWIYAFLVHFEFSLSLSPCTAFGNNSEKTYIFHNLWVNNEPKYYRFTVKIAWNQEIEKRIEKIFTVFKIQMISLSLFTIRNFKIFFNLEKSSDLQNFHVAYHQTKYRYHLKMLFIFLTMAT